MANPTQRHRHTSYCACAMPRTRYIAGGRGVLVQSCRRGVLVLPGLGNNAADYAALSILLAGQGYSVKTVAISRLDWSRNAAALTDGACPMCMCNCRRPWLERCLVAPAQLRYTAQRTHTPWLAICSTAQCLSFHSYGASGTCVCLCVCVCVPAAAWWRGQLKPRPAVDWYLTRIDQAMKVCARARVCVCMCIP